MRLGYIILSFGFCGIVIHQGFAQQSYQSRHYGMPGTQHLYSRHLSGFTHDEILAHGADTVWDISDLIAADRILSEIVTPAEIIDGFTFLAMCQLSELMGSFDCLTIYGTTQQAWSTQDSVAFLQFALNDIWRFQRKTQTELLETFMGFTVDFGGAPTTFAVIYNNPDTVLAFPLVFNDTSSSHITWGINLAAIGQNIQYHSDQYRTTVVDGWGTVITPYDTLSDVLRVRSVIDHQDTVITDTLTLPIALRQVEYAWYDTSYGIPVMIANGVITDTTETITTVSYLADVTCPAPTWIASSDAMEYYSDDAGNALVNFSVEMSNAGIYTWDFGDGNIESSPGGIMHVYTSQGVYDIMVTGCMTNCLPLHSCTSQTLTIEVIDTTSSLSLPEAEGHGIRVFPNPAQNSISINVPVSQSLSCKMSDLHGCVLLSVQLAPGPAHLDISALPEGVYALQFFDVSEGITYRAMKIVLMR